MSQKDKLYTFLCSFFTLLVVMSNIVYQKFVTISLFYYKFEISSGAIFYPFTFLLTDLIAEFYGRKKVKFCLNTTIVLNILVALYLLAITNLKATEWSNVNNQTFHSVFGFYGFSFIGSLIACYCSQQLDVVLYLSIRKITRMKYLWWCNHISSSISLFFDTCIVIGLMKLFGIIKISHLWSLIMASYSFKYLITFLCIPIFGISVKLLKNITTEQSDNSMS
jgi:uncharacterized integral membrane protein (TIGR00697 family)